MGIDLEQELTSGFAAKLIRQKARQLVGLAGLTASDQDDLRQELAMAVLESVSQFDPEIAHWNVYATAVIERKVATILKERRADKRDYCRIQVSLSIQVTDSDGQLVQLAQQIGHEHQGRVTGHTEPDTAEKIERQIDVADLLASLPEDLREICERLKTSSVAHVARELGIPRRTLRRRMEQIRSLFKEHGFDFFR